MHSALPQQTPALAVLGIAWTRIGLQSFGGGASTQYLIQRTFVQSEAWITDEEFARFWNLCQLAPGINLVGLTILIGRRLAGWRGIVVSLAGLLLPSGAITCALAAGFAALQHSTALHAVMSGVIPASAGVMAMVGVQYARPLYRRTRSEGRASMALSLALVAAGVLALQLFNISVLIVLVSVAAVGAILFTPRRPRATRPGGTGSMKSVEPE